MKIDSDILYILLAIVLFVIEIAYLRLAQRTRIIDAPNERSSHRQVVVRGGGVIFLIAVIAWFLFTGLWPWFVAGAVLVGVASFLDDRAQLPAGVRFAAHLLSVLLLFYEASVFGWPIWLAGVALIVCIGAINAFNFMDGINGITGVYGLVCLASFNFIDAEVIHFTEPSLIGSLAVALGVFLLFNFRKQAVCFAGDVGSVSMAFALVFMMMQLIVTSGNFLWPVLFLVYGTDSVVTIIYRLRKKENIFKAHRQHLYQYLSNEIGWPHRVVSVLYGLMQLVINVVVIYSISQEKYLLAVGFAIVFIAGYVLAREVTLKKIGRTVSAR